MSNIKVSKDLILLGPVTKEVLMQYCVVSLDEYCMQKPKKRFKIRHVDGGQPEFRDFFILSNTLKSELNLVNFILIEQVSFAPAKFIKYQIYADKLPWHKYSYSQLRYIGETDSI